MELADLRLLHVPKHPGTATVAADPEGAALTLETCQRRVVVTSCRQGTGSPRSAALSGGRAEWLSGSAAYCFLVTLAAGLRSAVVGETEILAQFKQAWGELERSHSPFARELHPWIEGVLADAKEVREHFLRGTGGQGYGSLLRHVLGERTRGSILLLGAGALARGVLPYLEGDEIHIWNRTPGRAKALRETLCTRVHAPIRVLEPTFEAEAQGIGTASLVVACVPADQDRDRERVRALLGVPAGRRPRVAHLGIIDAAGSAWEAVPEPITLATLFAMDRRQSALREQRVAAALRWCNARARLRALDRCVSIAHGWEDLAGLAAGGAC
jgi:hypothetical protein